MRKNNKNAFTLIELLAVIVILAIIALIATPIILGIVEDARRDSFMRSVELVINATDIDIFGKEFTETYTYTINDGVVSNLEVGVKNTDGMNGSITYDTKGNDIYAIHNGKYCVIKEEGMNKAEIKDYVEGECELTVATDASYFTYVDILGDFRIVDVDACVEYHENMGAPNEIAVGLCNDISEWNDGMTLIEYANNYPLDYSIQTLIEIGTLVGVSTNTIIITGYSSEGPKDVVIPSRIDGKEVVAIGEYSFLRLELTSIVIPKTITGIGEGAFSSNSLQEVTIPSNVEYIGEFSFTDNLLQEVTISEGVKIIDSNSFDRNFLQTVTIPASVTYIGTGAFASNSLQTVIIENDDIELEYGVFCGNPIRQNVDSESYQKIYSINPDAFMCDT